MPMIVPVDGGWSAEFKHVEMDHKATIYTLNRPKMYYIEVLDCASDV